MLYLFKIGINSVNQNFANGAPVPILFLVTMIIKLKEWLLWAEPVSKRQ